MRTSLPVVIVLALVTVVLIGGSATAQISAEERQQLDMMQQTAESYMAAGKYAEAAAQLERVFRQDPSRLNALHELGQAYAKLKQYDKAASAYARAIELYPDDDRLLTNLGIYQLRAKDLEGAKVTYLKLYRNDPDAYDPNRWLGYIYEKTKDYDKAVEHYEAALAARPDEMKIMGSIAKIYMRQDRQTEALAMYERAIKQATADERPGLQASLGKLYIESEDYGKAAVVLAESVEADPGSAANQYNLGISYIQIENPSKAIGHLEKAIEIKPDFCMAYAQLAAACNDTKQSSRAMKATDNGLTQCTDQSAALYYQQGRALEGMELYEDAIVSFEKAVGDPTWGGAAQRQIQRQTDLIKRAQMMKNN